VPAAACDGPLLVLPPPHPVQYDAAAQTFTLRTRQSTKPSPGQPTKLPTLIPLRTALLGPDGALMPLVLRSIGDVGKEVGDIDGVGWAWGVKRLIGWGGRAASALGIYRVWVAGPPCSCLCMESSRDLTPPPLPHPSHRWFSA
jgi:hypothetical protein